MLTIRNTFQKTGGFMLVLFMYVSVCSASHINLHDSFNMMEMPVTSQHSENHQHSHKEHHEAMDSECCTAVLTKGEIPFEYFLDSVILLATLVVLLSLVLLAPFKTFYTFLKTSPLLPRTLVRQKTCMIC